MNLVEVLQVASFEEGADDRCPSCGHPKNRRNKKKSFFKCYGCRKEWSMRKDSMASKELELAYNTTHKMDNRIRQCKSMTDF